MRVALLAVLLLLPLCAPPSAKGQAATPLRLIRATAFPQPTSGSLPLPEQEVRAIVCRYDWPCETAMAIVWRESRYDPQAVNPTSGAAGWFQVHPIHGFPQWALFDPWFCTQVAFDLYTRYHWEPWRTQ